MNPNDSVDFFQRCHEADIMDLSETVWGTFMSHSELIVS